MTTKTYHCEVCNAPFEAADWVRRRGWARCCDKSCAAIRRERQRNRGQVWKRKWA